MADKRIHTDSTGTYSETPTGTGLQIKDGGITLDNTTPVSGRLTGVVYAQSGSVIDSPVMTAPDVSGAGNGYVRAEELTFTEVDHEGAGTYTGSVVIPAGSWLVDVIVKAVAVWDDGTSASLEVGDDDDPDGYFTAVDLLANDLTEGQTINFTERDGGVGGVYLTEGTSTHGLARYYAAANNLIVNVAVGGGDGTAGRTRVIVLLATPNSAAGTFTAS